MIPVLLLAALAGTAAAQGPAAQAELELARPIVAHRLVDTDGDGRRELVLVTQDGLVLVARADGQGALRLDASLWLPHPRHSPLAIGDLLPAPGEELLLVDLDGTGVVQWPPTGSGSDGQRAAPQPLLRRARNALFTGEPRLLPLLQDLNRDGRLDLLLPSPQGVQPFVQEAPAADGAPAFRALPLLRVPVQIGLSGGRDQGQGGLDREWQGNLVVPQVDTADLNGDGRPDLLTRDGLVHAFHLQAADGSFAAPLQVDLAQFEDSTPKAAVAPGSTIVLGDRQLLQRGDIDGDGIPDFVVAHRRKVWTFRGGKDGPQFTKARTQAVADDVSALLLVDLDDDRRDDLLAFQVQLPGIGALVLGLVQSIDIDVKAVGYRADDNGFAGAPAWRRVVTLRIPPLLSLLSRQEELLQRFTDIVGKARLGVRGAFTAPGRSDVALARNDGSAVEVFALDGGPPTLARAAGRRLLRRVLFEDPDPVFDLERLFALLAGFLDEVAGGLVGARQPAAVLPLAAAPEWRLVDLLAGELDGAPGDEVVAVRSTVAEPRRWRFEVLRVPAGK